mgnify:CR=1 FL=1
MDGTSVKETWWYPLKYGDTLSNHDWIPLYINRLQTSRFIAYAVAEGRREDIGTALLLWAGCFREDPAGTLPDDDVELAQIAKVGTDIDGWRAARAGALYGWETVEIDNAEPGSAPRLGHRLIAEIAFDMHKRKRGRDHAREAGRLAQVRSRVRKKMHELRLPKHMRESTQLVEQTAAYLDNGNLFVTAENVRLALAETAGLTADVVSLGRSGGVS